MSEAEGKVLVVDGDYDTLVAIATALRMKGHDVKMATDGRSGIEHAVELSPEVVLVDSEVRVLDVRAFLEVLRDNPSTADAHVFILGHGDTSRLKQIDGRAEPLIKPFNAEEVANRVDEILRARSAPPSEPEVQGDVAQVALFDLLQVFAQNKRTGKLELDTGGLLGRIWVDDGALVDATFGPTVGEKALHRILSIEAGQFAFFPDVKTRERRFSGSLDHFLMESVRRKDERARVESDLPDLGSVVELNEAGLGETEGSLVVARIAEHLDEARAIEELLDLVDEHDLELLGAIATMISSGALKVIDGGERIALCSEDEIALTRAAILRLRRADVEGPVRLAILSDDATELTQMARALRGVREYVPPAEKATPCGRGLLGSLGSIRLGGTELELFAVPLDPTARPLWGGFLGAVTVGLVLGSASLADLEGLGRALDISLIESPMGYDRPAGAADAIREAIGTKGSRTYAAPR